MPTNNESSSGAQQRSEQRAGEAAQGLQDDAKALLDTAREQGAEHLEHYREGAADQIESLARSASSAAEQLQENDTLGISHYISDAADSLGDFAGSLRGKTADELLQQAGRLARENPALFVTGSIALGFGLSRFLRASSPDLTTSASTSTSTSGWTRSSDDASYNGRDDFDPRTAADEELATRPPHENDVVRSNPVQSPDPLSPGAFASGGDTEQNSGIHPSGAELGSFIPTSGAASPQSTTTSTTADRPASKGEL